MHRQWRAPLCRWDAAKRYSFDCPVQIDVSCSSPLGPSLDSLPRRQVVAGVTRVSSLFGGTFVDDLPHASALIVGDVDGAVTRLGQSRRAVCSAIGLFGGTGEAIGKDLVLRRVCRFCAGEGNEHQVVSLLWSGCAIPRAMKCDEGAVLVAGGKLGASVKHQSIGRPVRREKRFRSFLSRAVPDCLSTIA